MRRRSTGSNCGIEIKPKNTRNTRKSKQDLFPCFPCLPRLFPPNILDQLVRLLICDVKHSFIIEQHTRSPFTGADALGKFQRDGAILRRLARLHVQLLAKVAEQFVAAAKLAGEAAANPQSRLSQRVLLVLEEAIEAHGVVQFRGAQFEHLGDLANRGQRHAAHGIVNQMQSRQGHRLLAGVAREVGFDLLSQFGSQDAHRSNSAAIIFRLPSTATMSLIWWPSIKYGKIAKWMYDGGRQRAR